MLDHNRAVLSFPVDKVRVTSFATANARAKGATIVKVELVVADPWELADLVRDLAAIRAAGDTREARRG